MDTLLLVKWHNHEATIAGRLGVFRDKNLYTDATLACERKFYNVHKLVLSTYSDYFSEMFDWTKCNHPTIVLKDIKSDQLEILLDYMYLGETTVQEKDFSSLMEAAKCLQIKGLTENNDEPLWPRMSTESKEQCRRVDAVSNPKLKRKRSNEDDGPCNARMQEDLKSSPNNTTGRTSIFSSIPALSSSHNNNSPRLPQSFKYDGNHTDFNNHEQANNAICNNQVYQPSDQVESSVEVVNNDNKYEEVEVYSNESLSIKVKADSKSYFNNLMPKCQQLTTSNVLHDNENLTGSMGESVGHPSTDLPEYPHQTTSIRVQGGSFGHSSAGSSTSHNNLIDPSLHAPLGSQTAVTEKGNLIGTQSPVAIGDPIKCQVCPVCNMLFSLHDNTYSAHVHSHNRADLPLPSVLVQGHSEASPYGTHGKQSPS